MAEFPNDDRALVWLLVSHYAKQGAADLAREIMGEQDRATLQAWRTDARLLARRLDIILDMRGAEDGPGAN